MVHTEAGLHKCVCVYVRKAKLGPEFEKSFEIRVLNVNCKICNRVTQQ